MNEGVAEMFIRLLVAEVKRLEVVAQGRTNEIEALKRQIAGPSVVTQTAPPEQTMIVTTLAP